MQEKRNFSGTKLNYNRRAMKKNIIFILGFTVMFIFSIKMSALYGAKGTSFQSSPNLVGEWKFNEGKGTLALDTSGCEKHGNIYSATYVPGISGTTLDFDGIDDHVILPTFTGGSRFSAFTIEAWINLDTVSKSEQDVFSIDTYSDGFFVLTVYDDDVVIGLNLALGQQARVVRASNILQPNKWFHVAGTWDGMTLKVFVNGFLMDSTAAYGNLGDSGNYTNIIGRRTNANMCQVDGRIDEIRLYDRAIDPSDFNISPHQIRSELQKGEDNFKFEISGKVYQVIEVKHNETRSKVVIDREGNLVSDRIIIEKAFKVGRICGYFPEPEHREERFMNFLQGKVLPRKEEYQQALNMIPVMEILSGWAFDLGPRAVVEAIKIALTGGGSLAVSAVQITKEVAKGALRNMAANPRIYVTTTIYAMLNESISDIERIEGKTRELRKSEVLRYEEVKELEDIYWTAIPKGYAAIRMYQGLSGDLISNLLRALTNSVDQVIKEVDYSPGKVTSLFLAKQFRKMIEVTNVSLIYVEEMKKWEHIRKDEDDLIYLKDKINKALEISNKYNYKKFKFLKEKITPLISFTQSPKLKWRFETHGEISSPAIARDGTIYFGSKDGYFYALNPDGSLKWKFGSESEIGNSPSISLEGIIYFGSYDNHLYALNPDGSLKWKYRAKGYVFSSPAIARDGTIYFGSWDGYFYALNPDGSLKWKYKTEDKITESSPAIKGDGTIYFGSGDEYLYALNPDGSLKWRFKTNGTIYSSPAIALNGTIYFGSRDEYLYALNPNGASKWKFKTNGSVSSPSLGRDETIYFGSYDNHLYALNPDGTLKWKFKTGAPVYSSPAICKDGSIYLTSTDNSLYALNSDGSLKWKFETDYWIFSSPTIGQEGTVYFGSNDHYFYALEGTSTLALSAWPKFHQNLQNTGLIGISRD